MEHNNELEVLKSVVIELLKESTLSKERTDELINKIMASTHTKVVEEVKEEVKKEEVKEEVKKEEVKEEVKKEEVKEEVKKEEVKAEPPKVETFVPKGTMPKGWKPAA